jgi:DNA-binding response OmpR family regulator
MKVLLVEDDQAIAASLAATLTAQRYVVDVASDGMMGFAMVQQWDYDLILLDVLLPKLDGIRLCRKLRKQGCHIPIMMLTAQADPEAMVTGLDAGADDFVTKPFDLSSLLARLRALQRRSKAEPADAAYYWGDLKLDPTQVRGSYLEQTIHLSPKEYNVLELFLSNPQRIFTRDAILDKLWKIDNIPSTATVTNLVKDLRRKLKHAGVPGQPISTIHGLGYQLDNPPAATKTPSQTKADRVSQISPFPLVQRLFATVQMSLQDHLTVMNDLALALQQDALTHDLQEQARTASHKLGTRQFIRSQRHSRGGGNPSEIGSGNRYLILGRLPWPSF